MTLSGTPPAKSTRFSAITPETRTSTEDVSIASFNSEDMDGEIEQNLEGGLTTPLDGSTSVDALVTVTTSVNGNDDKDTSMDVTNVAI